MPATSNPFRIDCEYIATMKTQYEVTAYSINPDKINWEKEAKTALEFLQRYSLPQFIEALKKEINKLSKT